MVSNPGQNPIYVSPPEKREVAEFLVQTSKAGYVRSRKQIMRLAESAAHDKGLLESGKRVSNGWYCRFMEREPQLILRRSNPIASILMECTSKEVMEEYFKLLKSTLTENNLLDKPSRIYNVDETVIRPEPIMLLELPIMLLSIIPKTSLLCLKLCSGILSDNVKFNSILYKEDSCWFFALIIIRYTFTL